ncbi:MAG: hypothetical protein C0404_00230 [Verrucomicrobia bacterium]|nr:hypothetical protein [Verrucomicrobiota bacterium]
MEQGNNRRLTAAVVVLSACLVVAVLWVLRGSHAPAKATDTPSKSPTSEEVSVARVDNVAQVDAPVQISPEMKKEIQQLKESLAGLEKQMAELEKKITATIQASLDARNAESDKTDGQALKREIAEIRRMIDQTVDSNPLVKEKQAVYARVGKERDDVVAQQVSLVDTNWVRRTSYAPDRGREFNELTARMHDEADAVLKAKFGKSMGDKIDKKAQEAVDQVYAKYTDEFNAIRERQKKFDDDFTKGQEKYGHDFAVLNSKKREIEKSRESARKDLEVARAVVLASDPAVAQLNAKLRDKANALQALAGSGATVAAADGEANRLSSAYSEMESEAIVLRDTIKKLEKEIVAAPRTAPGGAIKML